MTRAGWITYSQRKSSLPPSSLSLGTKVFLGLRLTGRVSAHVVPTQSPERTPVHRIHMEIASPCSLQSRGQKISSALPTERKDLRENCVLPESTFAGETAPDLPGKLPRGPSPDLMLG